MLINKTVSCTQTGIMITELASYISAGLHLYLCIYLLRIYVHTYICMCLSRVAIYAAIYRQCILNRYFGAKCNTINRHVRDNYDIKCSLYIVD